MRRMLVAAVGPALIALFANVQGAGAQEFHGKAVATSRPTPQFGLWTWLADELQKRTNGRVQVEVVSLPELGMTGFELVRVTSPGTRTPASSWWPSLSSS